MSGLVDLEQKALDEQIGNDGEDVVLTYLQTQVNPDIRKYPDKFNVKDYYLNDDEGNLIKEWEVKTRRIKHNQYPTLVFGLNKLKHSLKMIKEDVEQTYLFNCIDGLYKWDFKDYKTQKANKEFYLGTIANKKRNDKTHDAVHIWHQHLTKLQ